jgi:drug/metabolite transporter (DMT)-like permease
MLEHQSWLGAGAALLSAFAWAASVTIYRIHGAGASGNQINLLKNSIATLCFAVLFLFVSGDWHIETRDWFYLLVSGLAGFAIADSALLASIKRLDATVPTALQCLIIPAATWLAYVFQGERLAPHEWIGTLWILLGVSGVIWSSRSPSQRANQVRTGFMAGVLLALLSVAGQAVGWALAKSALENVGYLEAASIRLGITIPFLWALIAMRGETKSFLQIFRWHRPMAYLASAGVTGTFLGIILGTLSAKFAKLGVTMALLTTTPIFTVPLAYFAQGEKTKPTILAFVLFTILGVFLMLMGDRFPINAPW